MEEMKLCIWEISFLFLVPRVIHHLANLTAIPQIIMRWWKFLTLKNGNENEGEEFWGEVVVMKILTQILISMVCHFVAQDIYSLIRIFLSSGLRWLYSTITAFTYFFIFILLHKKMYSSSPQSNSIFKFQPLRPFSEIIKLIKDNSRGGVEEKEA